MTQHPPQTVLIVLLGAIGDVVRALPVAVRLKKAWPACRVTWAVEPPSLGMVADHRAVDRVVVFHRGGGLSAYRRFLLELRREQYDVALDLQRHLKSGFTCYSSGAVRRIGFHRRNSREGNWLFQTEHIPPVPHFSVKTDQFQLFGDRLGLPQISPLEFGLSASQQELSEIDLLLAAHEGANEDERFVGFLVGSTWPSRLWGPSHYAALGEILWSRHGLVPALVGGPGDVAFAAAVAADIPPNVPFRNLVGKTSLRQLVPLFERTSVAVGSDSGPMHIASAVGIPVVSLWGPTSHRRSTPYGNEKFVLQSAIGCAPCYRKRCPGLDRLCLRSIPAEAVAAQVEFALATTRGRRILATTHSPEEGIR